MRFCIWQHGRKQFGVLLHVYFFKVEVVFKSSTTPNNAVVYAI